MPDFSLERALGGLVVGIDEAGRGPWAGPVVAAAVNLKPRRLPRTLRRDIDDSKRLSPLKRLSLFAALKENAAIGIGRAEVAEIDRINILQASLVAMTRALDHLGSLGCRPDGALVDGNHAPTLPCPVRCVVRGDALSLSVAAASIVAKVTRDRLMTELARICCGYGWETNFGYGTPEHRAALEELGATPHHRRSFAPIVKILEMHGELHGGFGPQRPGSNRRS